MYAFLFVLVPLATVIAWALARDRKRRHAHGADMRSRTRAARESAKSGPPSGCYAITHDGRAGSAVPSPMPGGTGPPSRRRGAWLRSPVKLRGSGEVRGGQPDLGSCARGSGAGRVVHLRLRRRAGRGGSGGNPPPVPAGSAGRVCTPSACISLSRLAHSIDTQLKGNVVGYVALIGHVESCCLRPCPHGRGPAEARHGTGRHGECRQRRQDVHHDCRPEVAGPAPSQHRQPDLAVPAPGLGQRPGCRHHHLP